MRSLRLGGVSYLNARPLTWALDQGPAPWSIRYDVPSVCAELLLRGDIDLGLVSSIEYLRSPSYRLVPGVAIGSRGPVASVGLYTRVPIEAVRTIAVDTSSRTSVALVRILCERHFRIRPAFMDHGPDLAAMTRACDAGLLIGDPALAVDHEALGLTKFDLGAEWFALTALPFVYAAWTGPRGVVDQAHVAALVEAKHRGTSALGRIAAEYAGSDLAAVTRAEAYLRDNVRYDFGALEAEGLQLFLDYAVELGLAPTRRALEYF